MTPEADPRALPGIPLAEDGPVFAEPWEARAFALAVGLHAAGAFTWPEWAAALAAEIGRDPEAQAIPYYRHWLAALERLAADKGLVAEGEVAGRASRIVAAAANDHDHDHHHDHEHDHSRSGPA